MCNSTCFHCHYNFDDKCSIYNNLDVDEAVEHCQEGPVTGFEEDSDDFVEEESC